MACSRKFSTFGGLITRNNEDLGSEIAIKTTRSSHIELKAVRKHDAFTRDNITKYIKEGLEKDSPVAMLIGTSALDGITITMPNGASWIQDISLHWVTITELKIDEVNDTVKVKVSTWGRGWCELDLDEYLEEWIYAGILYFE